MKQRVSAHPHLLEINAWAFMHRMRRRYGTGLSIGSVPAREWERIASCGFSYLWLMGVWERSEASKSRALMNEGLRKAYTEALPDWSPEDVAGSPYAVYSYRVDPHLGDEADLVQARNMIHEAGMGLILDFVPNHLAMDHPWTVSMPECFIRGDREAIRREPSLFFPAEGGTILAHGRDPYFPPWNDTVQINIFSDRARAALFEELRRIAEYADGVRCDMAMLVLNDTFARTWERHLGGQPVPEAEFWDEAIAGVKSAKPEFMFIAEAYWGLEGKLQDLGFDYTYDKVLYDLMLHAAPGEVRRHLQGSESIQRRCLRFIENHDEQRAVSAFGRERACAAAAVMATVPGMHLFHDGQIEGSRLHAPVQLARTSEEPVDQGMVRFYDVLLGYSSEEPLSTGTWKPLDVRPAWEGNGSSDNLLAWLWFDGETIKLVCINYSDTGSQGRIRIPPELIVGQPPVFRDALTKEVYIRSLDEVTGEGLYIELGPWKTHLLDLLV